jgi:DNA invertase Pin-like site-specific DNA recombinase
MRLSSQLAGQRGFKIVGEYCDEGVSGSSDSRPQLDRMLADAQRGKFSSILIWRLDRLGRSLQHLVRLFENFRTWNVALILSVRVWTFRLRWANSSTN